jgi:hypothetical protein
LELCPEIISTSFLAMQNSFARISISSLFALPSTGGEVSLTFNASPYCPTMPAFDERGSTLIFRVSSFLISGFDLFMANSIVK